MASSLKGSQTIVDVSVNYAREHDGIYNGSKSQCLIFPSNSGSLVKRHISIDGNVPQNVNEVVHLGHHVSVIKKDCMLQHAISQVWRSFNIFRVDFGRHYPEIQCDLFIAYYSSFYGALLWDICSATFKQLCAAWWKCLRKIWRVHPMTHCDVIALLLHCKQMEIGIQQRFCKFVANIFPTGTPVMRTIVLTALNNPLSVFVVTIIPSLVTVIRIVSKSGPTCTKTGSPHCLGIWYAMRMHARRYTCIYFILWRNERLYWRYLSELRFYVSSSCITSCHILVISDIFIRLNLLLFIVIACVFIYFFTLTHMWFLSMCFTVPYILVKSVRIKIYIYINNREPGDLRRHRAYYDVTEVFYLALVLQSIFCSNKCQIQTQNYCTFNCTDDIFPCIIWYLRWQTHNHKIIKGLFNMISMADVGIGLAQFISWTYHG